MKTKPRPNTTPTDDIQGYRANADQLHKHSGSKTRRLKFPPHTPAWRPARYQGNGKHSPLELSLPPSPRSPLCPPNQAPSLNPLRNVFLKCRNAIFVKLPYKIKYFRYEFSSIYNI